ncbi:MAG: class I SAM-dependent methyltransferase [Nitrospirae bacterium]|nr:class I SAM-dependent methyltransferase [Nitrospirota bacterium]
MSKYFTTREICPACKSSNKTPLLSLKYTEPPIREYLNSWYSYKKIDFGYLEGSNYILDECKDCGLVYQEEILNESTMVRLYNEWFDYEKVSEWLRTNLTIKYYSAHAKDLVSIISYLDIIPGNLRVLDFGMGFGTWCYLAKGLGCNVYGAEISQTRIDFAEGIDVINWEDIPDYRFDLINAEQVFEHLAEPLEVLTYLRQSLKPNGLIKINVPDAWDIKRRLKTWDWEALKSYKDTIHSVAQLQLIKSIWDWEAPQGSGSESSINSVAPLQHINCFNHDALVRMAGRVRLTPIVIPAMVADAGPAVSLKQRIKNRVKATGSRWYRLLVQKKEVKRKNTKVFLRNC